MIKVLNPDTVLRLTLFCIYEALFQNCCYYESIKPYTCRGQQFSLMQNVIPIDIKCLFMVYDTLNMDLSYSCTTSYQCSNRR